MDFAANTIGFATSARDLARFGLLVLAEGKWNKDAVLKNSKYLLDALQPSQNLKTSYGLLWWLLGPDNAVAARIVPFGSATDEGGSIRVPASYCGLFGLKPSRGRNPVGPDFSNEWNGMSHSHVITRTVRDSAAMLDAVAGQEPGSPYSAPLPARPFLEEVGQLPSTFRIAYSLKQAYGREIHPNCRKAVEETVSLLKDLGHQVEEVSPDLDETEVFKSFVIVIAGHVAAKLEEIKTVWR